MTKQLIDLIVQAIEKHGLQNIAPLRESFRKSIVIHDQLIVLWVKVKGCPKCFTALKGE